MTRTQLLSRAITAAERYVKKQLGSEGSHDWQHIQRVRRTAIKIARQEKADIALVELTAILHETTDWKLIGRKTEAQALRDLSTWLKDQKLEEEDIKHILYVIKNQSYTVAIFTQKKLPSLEGQILQDADRLEAIGAIGIARCFAYGGRAGRPIYDSTIAPKKFFRSTKHLRRSHSTSINHFYEKLLRVKGLMNTKTGKRLAKQRHRFMEQYLTQFLTEMEGKR